MTSSIAKIVYLHQPLAEYGVNSDIKNSKPASLEPQGQKRQELAFYEARRKGFFKLDIEYGVGYLIEAGKTKAGQVLHCLIKNMQFGNVAYMSPQVIALELDMDISHVRKYLKSLEGDGHIASFKTDNNGYAYLVSPAIGVKGNKENEIKAKAMWLALGNKRIKRR